MAAITIPWPVTALPGRYPGESQGTLVNAYAVKIGEQIVTRRAAGLDVFKALTPDADLGRPRGQLEVGDSLIHAWANTVYRLDSTGTNISGINGFPGTLPASLAKNQRPITPDVVLVSPEFGALIYDLADDTVKPYPSGSMGAVTSVEYYSGYFFFTRQDGTIIASDLQQTTIPGGSEARAEYAPDTLWRTKSVGSALAVMSSQSTEFWVDTASSPFPCQRQAAIDVGLISPWAVAGGTNEWENGLLWVAGDWTVRMLVGYEARIISTDDVVHDIRNCSKNHDDLIAQVYVFNAQAIWSLTSPHWTWEYNLTTGNWHKRESYRRKNWRSLFATRFGQEWIGQDLEIYAKQLKISPDFFWEVEDRLRFMIESAPVKDFPANIRIPSVDIDMTVALGKTGRPSPFETDPVVMVSWSHNGGAVWSNPVARGLGREGRFATKVTVNNLGRSTSQGVMIRLEVVDPVWVQVKGAVSTRTRGSRARAVNA